jgi:hypothetical protein
MERAVPDPEVSMLRPLLCSVLLGLTCLGCQPKAPAREVSNEAPRPAMASRTAAPARPATPPPADAARALSTVARCFHRSVSILQAEPASGEILTAFLARARQRATGGTDDACFRDLWHDATGRVAVGPGAPVSFERRAAGHSSYDDGHSELTIPYRFTAPGVSAPAETTIILALGGSRRP